MKIVVGVDGSDGSERAVDWCAGHAERLGAEVLAVHAVVVPMYAWNLGVYAPPVYSAEEQERILETLREKWCKPLTDANVRFEPKVVEGYPAQVIMEVADSENADLVVTGSRGLGGFKEMMLGSTSRELSHHLKRPLLIVP
jgi:nucleotide-binding universal stress UspA family protein